MSLGALDFGLIVDGAVVMVENVVRRRAEAQHERSREAPERTILEACLEVARPVVFAVAIIGIVLLTLGGHGSAAASGGSIVPGVILGFVAGLAYALYTYSSSRAIRVGQAPRGVMGGMFGFGAVALLPVLIVLGAPLLQSPQTIGITAYLAIGPMFVAYLLFGIGMRTLRSSTATTITLLEPFVATLLAVFVVGETLEPIGWIGLVLILFAVTVLATARQPREKASEP